jgi:electron transfer flavoprotein alpha subunit
MTGRLIMNKKEVWTISEINHQKKLKPVSLELLARGRTLADRMDVSLSAVVLGNPGEQELQDLIYYGADKIYWLKSKMLDNFIVENYSNVIEDLAKKHQPQIIIAAATTQGRTLMPHLSIRLKTGLTADCTDLQIEEQTGLLLQVRPAIGGNIMAMIKTPQKRPQMATVRPKSITPLPKDTTRKGQILPIIVKESLLDKRVTHLGYHPTEEQQADISTADFIIAGGRGLKKKENLSLIYELARQLNAAVGASREVVDRGWISYSHQVGLSGKTVNPKTYLAIGISGAIQHLAGMKTSDTIIAINNDPQADIFKIADFGIAGDLFEIIPLLKKRLEEKR